MLDLPYRIEYNEEKRWDIMKKQKIITICLFILLAGMLGLAIAMFVIGETDRGVKASLAAVAVALAVVKMLWPKLDSRGFFANQLETIYKNEIGRAFIKNPKLRKKFIKSCLIPFVQKRYMKCISALDNMRKYAFEDEDDAALLFFNALCFSRLGYIETAVEKYKQCVEKRPYDHIPVGNLGYCQILAGQYDDAEKSLKKSVELNPHYPTAHGNLAYLYCKTERYVEAIEAGLKAKKLDASMHEADSSLAISYAALKDEKNADKYYLMSVMNGRDGQDLKKQMAAAVYLSSENVGEEEGKE